MPAPLTHLGDIPVAQFLREYWQRKPLLVRQALPDFKAPLEPDELAGLALEEEIESRIVIENCAPAAGSNRAGNAAQSRWELRRGPFTEADFQRLPASHWTLLVQAVDHWLPEVSELLDYFRFLPNWRLDDVMISYAPDQGSVGPHYDYYDVFLLQAAGKRRWRLGQHCTAQSPHLPDSELNILAEFKQRDEWLLEPGDMLYIPPQVAHWGIAEGEGCMTCSIGFRAPSHAELLGEFSQELAARLGEELRFSDAGAAPQHNPGELTAAAVAQVQAILRTYLDRPDALADWFGRYMTTPKYASDAANCGFDDAPEHYSGWPALLAQPGASCCHCLSSRFAYHQAATQAPQVRLFADGESYDCPAALAQLLCRQSVFSLADFAPFQNTPEAHALLTLLFNRGSLEIVEL